MTSRVMACGRDCTTRPSRCTLGRRPDAPRPGNGRCVACDKYHTRRNRSGFSLSANARLQTLHVRRHTRSVTPDKSAGFSRYFKCIRPFSGRSWRQFSLQFRRQRSTPSKSRKTACIFFRSLTAATGKVKNGLPDDNFGALQYNSNCRYRLGLPTHVSIELS
jgi:hypothetical protein